MENSKTTKRFFVWALCLAVVVLFGLSIFQYFQFRKLSQSAISENISNNGSTKGVITAGQPTGTIASSASKERGDTRNNFVSLQTTSQKQNYSKMTDPGENDNNDLESHLNETEEKIDVAQAKLAQKSESKKKKSELEKEMSANYKTMDAERFKAGLDSEYGPLFKQLNLSQEKLAAFKQLLIDKRFESMDIKYETRDNGAITTMSDNPEKVDEYNTKISQFLGAKDYEKFQAYEDSGSERYRVSDFIKSLGSDDKITDYQQQKLVSLMYEKRSSIKSELEKFDTNDSVPGELNEEKIALNIKRIDRTDEAYLAVAGNVLSPAQFDKFKAYLKGERDQAESSMKMYLQVSAARSSQKSSDKKE
jgi:hypothetical protein